MASIMPGRHRLFPWNSTVKQYNRNDQHDQQG